MAGNLAKRRKIRAFSFNFTYFEKIAGSVLAFFFKEKKTKPLSFFYIS